MKINFKTLLNKYTSFDSSSVKRLSKGKRGTGGRNNTGRITIRRRGGGHKRRVYNIDYAGKIGQYSNWKIKEKQYNPNSSSHFILLCESTGGRLKYLPYVSDAAKVGNPAPIFEKIGNIRVGTEVCNIERKPGFGGQYIRAAGTSGTIIKKENSNVYVKLPSNKIIDINGECSVIRGRIGNEEHRNRILGKAGRNRWLGIRPKVRGEAMNPVDHPHGGKSSRSGGAGKPFKNIWGKLAKWAK